jgi:DNA-binding beta-propeller fold protein YncE
VRRELLIALLACPALCVSQQPVQIAKLVSDTPLRSVAVCNQGSEVIGIDKDRKVHLWTLPLGTQRLIATSAEPTTMAICSPDGKTLALATRDGRVTVIDTTKNRSSAPISISEREPNGIDISNSGLIAAALTERAPRLLRGNEKAVDLQTNFGGTNGIAISADGSLVATADTDTMVRIYDSAGHLKSAIDAGPLEPFLVAFSPDAKEVYVTGADAVVRTVDVAAGKIVRTSEKLGTAVLAMSMSSKGDEALLLMMDEYTMAPNSVAIWNAKSNTGRKVDLDPKAFIGGGTGKNGWILVKQEEKALTLWEVK